MSLETSIYRKPTHNLRQQNRLLKDAGPLHMFVYLANTEMSWTLRDTDGRILRLKTYISAPGENHFDTDDWKACLLDEELDPLHIIYCTLAVADMNYTLVPSEFYTAQNNVLLYKTNHTVFDKISVIAEKLDNENYYFLYGANPDFKSWAEKKFSNLNFTHPLIASIASYKYENKLGLGNKVLVQIFQNRLNLFLFRDEHFDYINSFLISAPQDILYYLMNLVKEKSLDRTRDVMVLFGHLQKDDETHRLITEFFSKVYFGHSPDRISYCDALGLLPLHMYYHLYCL